MPLLRPFPYLMRFCLLALCLLLAVPGIPPHAEAANAQKISSGVQSKKKSGQAQRKAKTVRKTNKNGAAAVKNGKASNRASARRAAQKAKTSPGYAYKSCVIYNAKTNKVLFTDSQDRKIPPASLTKILSMYVAEDAIQARKLNRRTLVTVSAKAASAGGSRMGLRKGDKVPLDDLLRGMAVASGNDASIAVAEFIGGSEQKFVRMMNQKARSIGMGRSTFKNANGLPAKGQYTTAKDMLAMARSYLAAYPGNLKKYHNQSIHVYKNKYSSNANPLLGVFEGADGLKTGYVNASGYNLIATAKRGEQRYIGVILGAPSSSVRAVQARNLMEACFTKPSVFTADSAQVKTASAAKKNSGAVKKTSKSGRKKAAVTAGSSNKSVKNSASASGRGKKPAAGSNTAEKGKKGRKGASLGIPTANQLQRKKGPQPLVLLSYTS